MRPLAGLALTIAGLAIVPTSQGGVLRVPQDFPTVQEGVSAAAPFDTVLVSPGTYREGAEDDESGVYAVATIRKPLTLKSTGGSAVTSLQLDEPPVGVGRRVLTVEEPDGPVVIEGFTVRGLAEGSDQGLSLVSLQDAVVRDCRFLGFRGPLWAMELHSAYRPFLIESCEFDDCTGSTIVARWRGFSSSATFRDCLVRRGTGGILFDGGNGYVLGCTFEDNEGYALRSVFEEHTLTVEDTVFRGNIVTGVRPLVEVMRGNFRRCRFERNVAMGAWQLPALNLSLGRVEDCYFYGNEDAGGHAPVAASISEADLVRNVFAGNRGAAALRYFAPDSEAGCNLFWNNPDGNLQFHDAVPPEVGWEIDPQLCDPDGGEPNVMSTSPCLPENSGECGGYALFELGCASRGTILDTEPPHLQLVVDGMEATAPLYREWSFGSTHTIEAPDTQNLSADRRAVFASWSHGGERAHEFRADLPGAPILAAYTKESLLTMTAPSGSAVLVPGTGWYPNGTVVEIAAIPNSPWLFAGWASDSPGGYAGQESATSIVVKNPILQNATLYRHRTSTFRSTPPGVRLSADGLEFHAPHSFDWFPGTTHRIVLMDAPAPSEGVRHAFDGWSDGVADPSRTIQVPDLDRTYTAQFRTDFLFRGFVAGEGSISVADSSWFESGTDLNLVAEPALGWKFVGWIGEGDASYTGPEPAVTLDLTSPVTQTAIFERALARIVLSLSETDPDVSTSPEPLGLSSVHLWLVCQEGVGLGSLATSVAGTIPVFAFSAAPGVANNGSAADLDLLVTDCPDASRRLGQFIVSDVAGGELCLVPTAGGLLQATDCDPSAPITFAWPTTLSIRGIRTDGGTPCESGMGCDSGRRPTAARVAVDDLRGPHPNPLRDVTSVEFELAESAVVHLCVYDVAGRLVRRLASGPQSAGRQSVGWDARGESGMRVPAGVYFVRMDAGSFTATRKAIVLN